MKLPGILAHAVIDRPWALLESGGGVELSEKSPIFTGFRMTLCGLNRLVRSPKSKLFEIIKSLIRNHSSLSFRYEGS